MIFLIPQVGREIDNIIPRVAEHLPLDPTINILKPFISTGAFPTNLCALKILLELTDRQGPQISEEQLTSLMEHITKVCDATFSCVVCSPPSSPGMCVILRSEPTTPNRWSAKRRFSASSSCTLCWARNAFGPSSVCSTPVKSGTSSESAADVCILHADATYSRTDC